MPDVWTTNPEKLRSYLIESGSICGVEGRVLKGRSPEWTCTYDSKGWLRDVYIHPVHDLYTASPFVWLIILVGGLGMLLGLMWGRWFWRRGT